MPLGFQGYADHPGFRPTKQWCTYSHEPHLDQLFLGPIHHDPPSSKGDGAGESNGALYPSVQNHGNISFSFLLHQLPHSIDSCSRAPFPSAIFNTCSPLIQQTKGGRLCGTAANLGYMGSCRKVSLGGPDWWLQLY